MESHETDPMTACVDRELTSLLGQRADPSLAVMMIRLDRFKALHESRGHATANDLLNLAEQRLQSALPQPDRVFRLPDHEFAILLANVESANDAGIVAHRLSDLLQRAYMVRGQIINSSASIGIALAPQNGLDSETLLKHASMALQSAVAMGPDTAHFFEVAIEERIVAGHALALDLRKALLLHQFEVHYQPQVDIGVQHLTGFEALLRWRHPELGWVSPVNFIPLAEEIGMIGMIGEWVLRTSCLRAALLPEEITIAVNASPSQFSSGTFVESVEKAISISAIAPTRLEIEVTEGVLMQNSKMVLSTLDGLRSLGVRLAMDDFGTGYSSLGQLARFPFNKIKIDRSLVIDRPTEAEGMKQRAIVRAITTLGKGLGMCTLVEGIETERQLVNAYADGCISAQGYLFGKAVSADTLDDVVASFAHRLTIPMDSSNVRSYSTRR